MRRTQIQLDERTYDALRRQAYESGVRTAFAFDHHFEEEGFAVYGERG